MKYYLDKKNNSVFTIGNFEYTPRENRDVEISKEEYDTFFKTEETEEIKLNKLRAKRTKLLLAFDKYKSNVNYGIVLEDEETRSRIVSWYSDLLNLVESSFEENNIPSEIKYYL